MSASLCLSSVVRRQVAISTNSLAASVGNSFASVPDHISIVSAGGAHPPARTHTLDTQPPEGSSLFVHVSGVVSVSALAGDAIFGAQNENAVCTMEKELPPKT